jgi:hypothetical protein
MQRLLVGDALALQFDQVHFQLANHERRTTMNWVIGFILLTLVSASRTLAHASFCTRRADNPLKFRKIEDILVTTIVVTKGRSNGND